MMETVNTEMDVMDSGGHLPVRSELDQDWVGAIVTKDGEALVGTVREVVNGDLGSAHTILFGTWADGSTFGEPAARLTRLDMHLVQRLLRERDVAQTQLRHVRAQLAELSEA